MNSPVQSDLEAQVHSTRQAVKFELGKLCRRKKETDKLSQAQLRASKPDAGSGACNGTCDKS